MDMIISIIFGVSVGAFVIVVLNSLRHLDRISKHLRIIRLQLEIQNPMFTSNQLLELDKNINYWEEKMWKYKDRYDDKDKEINDVTFKLFWAYVSRLNHFRVMVLEAKASGDQDKISKKYEKWLDKNEKEIDDLEEKAKVLDTKIKEDLEKRSLDFEFLGKWDRDEN